MPKDESKSGAVPTHPFRFSLVGLILLIVCVMLTTAAIPRWFLGAKEKAYAPAQRLIPDPDLQNRGLVTRKGPWGELLTQNIMLELPVEYISQDALNPEPETWKFTGRSLGEIKALLVTHGLTQEQVETQVTPERIAVSGSNTVLTPDEGFLLSLNRTTRARLYGGLYGLGVGLYLDFPCVFPNGSIADVYADPRLNPEDVALLKQLVYPAENADRLSDYKLLLRRIPTIDRRQKMAKAISKEPAVLARLCVRPDSDIDKIAAYWGNMDNVRFTDLRPMLEALKALPDGGTVSLPFFLPPFARARLYTYPLPPRQGDPEMDCHWSTFNFSNLEINNEINDPRYTTDYIRKHLYEIDSPSLYGDILLYLNSDQTIKHSAVYLADDLAFTKYGATHRQPWMIVRMDDMQAMYPAYKLACFRRKER